MGARRLHAQEGGLSWQPQRQEMHRLGDHCLHGPPGFDPAQNSGPTRDKQTIVIVKEAQK